MLQSLLSFQSDAGPVRAVAARRADALEVLVQRYQRRAHAVARAAGAFGADAEDAVQDAFVLAIERLGQLREPERFGSWFLRIVRNAAASRLRRAAFSPENAALDAAAVDATSPALVLERREIEERVAAAVKALPKPLREAVLLYYYEDH
jgi:RNA polymerase sigma-70 factor (ECF subfamily)